METTKIIDIRERLAARRGAREEFEGTTRPTSLLASSPQGRAVLSAERHAAPNAESGTLRDLELVARRTLYDAVITGDRHTAELSRAIICFLEEVKAEGHGEMVAPVRS